MFFLRLKVWVMITMFCLHNFNSLFNCVNRIVAFGPGFKSSCAILLFGKMKWLILGTGSENSLQFGRVPLTWAWPIDLQKKRNDLLYSEAFYVFKRTLGLGLRLAIPHFIHDSLIGLVFVSRSLPWIQSCIHNFFSTL